MHKAKNIYFILIWKKETRWPKAGGRPKQNTFLYIQRNDLTFL